MIRTDLRERAGQDRYAGTSRAGTLRGDRGSCEGAPLYPYGRNFEEEGEGGHLEPRDIWKQARRFQGRYDYRFRAIQQNRGPVRSLSLLLKIN